MIATVGCSKKALTELASSENQNQSNSGDSGSNGGGSNGNQFNQKFFLLNVGTSFAQENGNIIQVNPDTGSVTDINTGTTNPLMSVEISSTLENKNSISAFDISRTRSYLVEDLGSGNYGLRYLNLDDGTFNSTSVQLQSGEPDIAISGDYAIVTDSSSVNQLVNGNVVTPLNTFLSLNGSTEDVSATSQFYALGSGKFIVASSPNGQSSNQLIIFDAANASTAVRVATNYSINTVIKYSDSSAIVAVSNTAGDKAIYFINYSDLSTTKIYENLIASGEPQLTLFLMGYQDSNQDYYVLLKKNSVTKFTMLKINHTNGAVTTAAEQNWTGLNNGSMNDCNISNNSNTGSGSFRSTVLSDSKMFFTCSTTSNKTYLIEANFANQTLTNYLLLNSALSSIGLAMYKNELYTKTGSNTFAKVEISNGTLTTTTTHQLKSDLIADCSAKYSNLDCANLTTSTAIIGSQPSSSYPFGIESMLGIVGTAIRSSDNSSHLLLYAIDSDDTIQSEAINEAEVTASDEILFYIKLYSRLTKNSIILSF